MSLPKEGGSYGRFLGTIFFGGAHSPEDIASQQLVNTKNH
jgi:hypothetical protein